MGKGLKGSNQAVGCGNFPGEKGWWLGLECKPGGGKKWLDPGYTNETDKISLWIRCGCEREESRIPLMFGACLGENGATSNETEAPSRRAVPGES